MQDFLTRFPHIDAVLTLDDDDALGVLDAIRQAGRQKEMWVLGGGGMKEAVKRVMNKDSQTPATVIYYPSMIGVAIELTSLHFITKLPMSGVYILNSTLVRPENASQFYFPNSPY
jgi:ribose transport system substrate-binding protein